MINKQLDVKIKEATQLGAEDVAADLKQVKKELGEMVNNPGYETSELLSEAMEIHPQVRELVEKYTSRRGPQVGPDHFKKIAAIMSEKLAERAPITKDFIDFWKRLGQEYTEVTKKTDIPWVTFDGKVMKQSYRPKVQYEVRFYDPESKRYIRNIYQTTAEDGKLLGKRSIGYVRLGLGVNGNHAARRA